MRAVQTVNKQWATEMVDPPKLSSREWNVVALVGIIFLIAAILQVIGFSDYKLTLGLMGLDNPATWAVALIIAELIAAFGFFKFPLTGLMRMLTYVLALLVSGFWLVITLKIVSVGGERVLSSNAFFGRFLSQVPGWWTVLEATVFFFLTLYAVELLRNSGVSSKRRK